MCRAARYHHSQVSALQIVRVPNIFLPPILPIQRRSVVSSRTKRLRESLHQTQERHYRVLQSICPAILQLHPIFSLPSRLCPPPLSHIHFLFVSLLPLLSILFPRPPHLISPLSLFASQLISSSVSSFPSPPIIFFSLSSQGRLHRPPRQV